SCSIPILIVFPLQKSPNRRKDSQATIRCFLGNASRRPPARPKKGIRDMDRKKFITGLMALGAMPAATGSLLSVLPAWAADPPAKSNGGSTADDLKYTANEITEAGANFFGITTEAMAKAVEHVFGDLGQPDAYIKGDEGSGAFVVGLRYGSGWLVRKTREPQQ